MLKRMIGAARLDAGTYEEVEADSRATLQAMAVVVLVALATGVGALGAGGGLGGLVFGVFGGLFFWAIWALVTYVVGSTILRDSETEANWGQLARTTGFAQSPGVLRVFAVIPTIGPAIAVAASLWQLAAMVVAVRQALDYRSTWRALGVVLVGFILLVVVIAILNGIFSPTGETTGKV